MSSDWFLAVALVDVPKSRATQPTADFNFNCNILLAVHLEEGVFYCKPRGFILDFLKTP